MKYLRHPRGAMSGTTAPLCQLKPFEGISKMRPGRFSGMYNLEETRTSWKDTPSDLGTP